MPASSSNNNNNNNEKKSSSNNNKKVTDQTLCFYLIDEDYFKNPAPKLRSRIEKPTSPKRVATSASDSKSLHGFFDKKSTPER